ncbi:MAG: Hsp70 family protein [Tatlockia sp.]|nr:Hsp70 family protein [Tatlockia sp.]
MIVAIDLGTTNSLIAVWDGEKPQIIPNRFGKFMTPSVVSADGDVILIGEPALNRLTTHPEFSVANFKRYMGTDKQISLNNFTFRTEELSALVLRQLKEDAEDFLKVPITEAIISVPAYFSDAQRKATKIAGELAGLTVKRLINEPTAAGIAYGLQNHFDDTNYLIFDLGGGTFDVTLLNMFSGVIEVRSTHGNNLLGGLDFTAVLERMFIDDLLKTRKISFENIPAKIRQKIHEQAELAKRRLSTAASTTMSLRWDDDLIIFHCTESAFEEQVSSLMNCLREPVKKVINDGKLLPSDIDQIVLVGGASRMKPVKKLVSRMFGKLPLCHIDLDTVVVQGVAVQAGLTNNHQALEEIVVTDVCPFSLGIAVLNNETEHFDPIIERNMTIPISRSKNYFPNNPDTAHEVDIRIYQGESFFLEKNIFLGSFTLNVDKALKNKELELRFTYDVDGLLEVEALVLENKEKRSLVIEGNPGVLSKKEIAERLLSLQKIKVHPREQLENQLVITRAEKLFEELQGEDRMLLSAMIKEFITVLNTQDLLPIARLRKDLSRKLNAIEQAQFTF